jgi:hypothetical protein
MYDDRPPFFNNSFRDGYGPPPPMPSYRSPYAESVDSHEASTSRSRHNPPASRELSSGASATRRSRYSEPVSPGARRTSDLPLSGFQYGSGPIPRDGEPFQQRPPSAVATSAPGVDPVWLNNLLKTAVKQGVEESRKAETQREDRERHKHSRSDVEVMSQPPGAWPESPFAAPAQPHRHFESVERSMRDDKSDHDTNWRHSQAGWGQHPKRSRAGTRVTIAEPIWETESSSDNLWNSREETPSDSWDTEDTWDTNKANEWEAASQPDRFRTTNAPSPLNIRPSSPVTTHGRDRRRSKHSFQRERESRSRSRPRQNRRRNEVTSSSEENEDWTSVERPSDVISMSSSNDTVRPSRSESQAYARRSRSKSHSRRSKSKHHDHEQRSSRHTPAWQPEVIQPPPAPPSMTHMVPTVMNGPISALSTEVRSRQASGFAIQPVPPVPQPGWGPAPTEQLRKSSNATGFMGPAPYAPSLKDFVKSTLGVDDAANRSTSSSSWGSDKKAASAKGSWEGKSKKEADISDEDNGWGEKNSKKEDKSGWETKVNDQVGDWGKTDNVKEVEASGWNTKNWDVPNSSKKDKNTDAAKDWGDLKDALANAFSNPQPPKTSPEPEPEKQWQNQSWNNQVTTTNPTTGFQWDTTDPWAPAPAPAANQKPEPTHHSNKSLSKYRQKNNPLFSIPLVLKPQPHWQFPPPPSSVKKLYPISEHSTYLAPKEPRYTISAKTASEKGVEHQVRAGKATEYGHAVGRPEYLDGLERPYAVFRFKYRSQDSLKGMFGEECGEGKDEERKREKEEEKERLKELPQEELIEKMMRLQMEVEGKGKIKDGKHRSHKHEEKEKKRRHNERKEGRQASGQTDVVAKNLTEQWVKQHSREPSEKAKSQAAKSEKKDKKDEQQSWGQNDGWGGGGDDDGLADGNW